MSFFPFLIATNTFDSDKILANFLSLSPYPTAFNSGQKNYFLTQVGPQNNFACTAPGTTPSYFQVGADGACSSPNCNGVLPQGSAMR